MSNTNPNVQTGTDSVLPRQLSYVPLHKVRPAIRNPKTHDHGAIIASIRAYGFTAPLLTDERTGRLVAGHGRLAALVEMNAQGLAIPTGLILGEDGDWYVPMIRGWSSKDDTEAEAYIVADNRLVEAGDWHQQTLAAMMEDITAADPGLLDTMAWTADDVDDLLRRTDTLPTVGDPLDGAQTIDVPAAIGEEDPDRPLGDDDEGTSYTEDRTTCPACAHSWVRDQDTLTVLGSTEPTRLGDLLRTGSGLHLSN